jgi:hypothetical protein
MPNPVAVNDLSPISGSLQTSRISYAVETAGKDYGQDYNGTTWYSDIPQNGSQYTIISDNYTANYYVSRSNAEGAYVEGGLPAVDEYSAPVFWLTAGTSSLDIITIVNGLPDRRGQIPFNSGSQALNWVASSSNYFAVGPPYEQIDADELVLYLQGNQVISYPTTGSSWYDISGYGTNGTLINGPTFNSSLGTIFLDGVDDFVTCSITNIAPTTFNNQDITFEILCNTTTNDNAYHTLMYVTSPNAGSGNYADITLGQWRNGLQNGSFYWQVSTTVQSYLIDSSTTYTSTNIATGKFFHVVGTWSKNGASYTGTLYVNGTSVASTNSAISTYTASDATKAYIGNDIYNSYRQGNINNSKIYSKALSAAEVSQNYYQGPVVTGSISGSYYANNLVSYVTGSTSTYNLSANIISGSLQNGVGFSPLNGGYWSFDGTDDRILLEGSTTNAWRLDSTPSWTVNAWIRVPNGSSTSSGLTYQGILSNTNGGPIHSVFQVANSSISYSHYNNAWFTKSGTIPVNDGNWHMLTWVNSANSMNFYVDGKFDSTVNSTMTGAGFLDVIGSSLGTAFLGDIASLQINQGKAFTSDEVLQQYNATK